MAIEQGIVVELGNPGGQTAWVETIVSPVCESCDSKSSCHGGSDKNKRKVEAINEAGAKVGDRIQLSLSSSSMLKATFLLYLFPVLCMLAGAIAANIFAGRFFSNPSLITTVTAFLFFGLAMLIVRVKGNRLAAKTAYRPKIIRIIGQGAFQNRELDATISCSQKKK